MIGKMDSSMRWSPMDRKILVYFKDDTLCKSLLYGDLILISGVLQTIAGPPNPYMFDFRKYLYNRQIMHQVFLEPARWHLAGRADCNPVRLWAEKCREKFLGILKKFKVFG